MIAICEECGEKHQIDPEKIKGKAATFSCKNCGNLVTAPLSGPSPTKPTSEPTPVPVTEVTSKPKAVESVSDSTVEDEPTALKMIKKKRQPQFIWPRKVRFGLIAKLFMVMMIVGLIPLIMFWGITLKQAKDRIRIESQKHTHHIFRGMARYVDAWFNEKARIIKELAKMNAIISMNRAKQKSLLVALRRIYPEMDPLIIINRSGINIAGNDGQELEFYTDKRFYKDIMGGKAFTWQTLTNQKTNKPTLILAAPIKNGEIIVGEIANSISIDKISRQVLTSETSDTGFAFLVRNKKNIVAYQIDTHGIKPKRLSWQPLITAFKSGRHGLIPFQNSAGISILGYVAKTSFGWGVAIQRKEKEAFALIDRLLSFAYLLLTITIVFVFIIAWFSGRAISRPIIKLTEAADRISVGELNMEIKTKRKDEIGDLSEAIARMQDSIRIAIERLRRRL
ncbi:HAMP domain-containing protein [Thermodesulfobacteriota bacterium]